MSPSPHPHQAPTQAEAGSAAPEPAELALELDRLRSASRENGAFIRATRRELRKPLNALVGILRDLSAQVTDHEAAGQVRTALHWAMSLGRLTNDLLDLAVMQAEDAEVGAVEFDVRDLVEEVSRSTCPPGVQDSPLIAEVRPEVPSMLIGHPNRMRQILTTGVQHMMASRATTGLRLGLARLSESPTHVDLLFGLHNVDHSAPPLDEETLRQSVEADFGFLVSQRLARGLGGSLEYMDGGDALHLRLVLRKSSAAEKIVDVSNAVSEPDLVVDADEPAAAGPAPSAPAAPAAKPAAPAKTVAPAAPKARATPAAPAPQATPAPPPARTTPASAPAPAETDAAIAEITLKGMRVLLAGSSGPSNVALQIELRALGCESAFRETVDEACDLLLDSNRRMRPFHICIADFSGSDEAAEQLVARVRAEAELRDLQMLLLVEMGSSGDAEWAEHMGYAAYLTKPVQRDDLDAVFKELLQRSVAVDPEAVRLITRHSLRETRRRRLDCLVVDDDRVSLLALKTVIERLGHAVELASCGTEALEKTAERRFDLILSDVRMPDLDGDEVAAQVLAMQAARGERPTPIFAMSANSLAGDSQRCRAAGMRNYFVKPVTLPLLTQLLRYALEDSAEPQAGEPAGAATEARAATGNEATATLTSANAAPVAIPVPEQEVADLERQGHYDEMTPIDLDHLEMASVGVPELRREMLETFEREMSTGIEHLGLLIEDGNHGGATMLASALNSTCASIGAINCSRHLSEIERRASVGDLDSLGNLYAESLAEWDRVKAFVAKLLAEPAPPAS